jgi:uncharacterized protein (TIGR03435 family)
MRATPSASAVGFPSRCDIVVLNVVSGRPVKTGRHVTLAQIAETLATSDRSFDRPVIDQTGLDGRFDFAVEWGAPAPGTPQSDLASASDPALTFVQAVRDQLGLKIDAAKLPMPNLVIDHIERPSEN